MNPCTAESRMLVEYAVPRKAEHADDRDDGGGDREGFGS